MSINFDSINSNRKRLQEEELKNRIQDEIRIANELIKNSGMTRTEASKAAYDILERRRQGQDDGVRVVIPHQSASMDQEDFASDRISEPSKPPRGFFLTFEGVDGAGKTSHIEAVCKRLEELGHTVVRTREPGGTALGEKLRAMTLHEEMTPMTEAMLMMAARHEHEQQVILPALARGDTVVCDRFKDSTFVFQGAGRGLSVPVLESIDRLTSHCTPTKTFLFDLPTEVARDRMGNRALDRVESMDDDFHQRVRQAYLDRVAKEPDRFEVFDSRQPLSEVAQAVLQAVERLPTLNSRSVNNKSFQLPE